LRWSLLVIITSQPAHRLNEGTDGLLPGIVLGSMIAYLTSQFIDVQIFEFWGRLTGGKYMWIRNNGSTFFSQLVDTIMVVTIALVIWPEVDGNPGTSPLSFETWRGIVLGSTSSRLASRRSTPLSSTSPSTT
jgi:hypothetical protein